LLILFLCPNSFPETHNRILSLAKYLLNHLLLPLALRLKPRLQHNLRKMPNSSITSPRQPHRKPLFFNSPMPIRLLHQFQMPGVPTQRKVFVPQPMRLDPQVFLSQQHLPAPVKSRRNRLQELPRLRQLGHLQFDEFKFQRQLC